MKKIIGIVMVLLMLMSVTGALAGADGTTTTKENQAEKTPVIIMFNDQTDQDLIKQHGGKIKSVYHLQPALAASLPQKAIDALKKHPKIDCIVPDLEIFTMGETLEWGVDRIDADIVHAYNKGAEVNVAIMDSGIDYNHLDLAGNYKGGYDFGGDYSEAPNDDDPMDHNGHGTHCAGIVAAVMGNHEGVIGVAPEADLYAVKVFTDDGYGWYSDTMEGLEWCIDTHSDDIEDNDIQVISMSFGSSGDPGSAVENLINEAYGHGILLVGAAGNEGNPAGRGDTVIYPARYDSVIAVAATDSGDNRAPWSSTGPDVELAAPGRYIYSTVLGGYATYSGTSMACPHVAGTAALVIASGSTDVVDVRARLQDTAEDLGDLGLDTKFGYGLVDAEAAADSAVTLESITVTPLGTVSIPKGLTQQYTATGTYSDTSTADITSSVTWASSNTAVATIDPAAGLATGVSDGSTDITATLDLVSDTAALTVTLALESIAVTPETTSISKGLTQQYTATGTYTDDSTADITSSVNWASSDIAVATINSEGLATGVGEGSTGITATLGSEVSNEAELTVTVPSEPTTVSVKSISYRTEGGRDGNKHLLITVALVDDLGNLVADASVSIEVDRDSLLYGSSTGTTGTGGTVTFQTNNAPSGTYTTKVTDVTAEGLTWDSITPEENSYPKE